MSSFDQNQRDQLASTIDLHFIPYGLDVTLSKRGASILADLVGQSGQESADVAALRAAQVALTQNVPTSTAGWATFQAQLAGPPTSTAWATTFWQQRFDPSSSSAPATPTPLGGQSPLDLPPEVAAATPPALDPSAFDPPTNVPPAVPPALDSSAFDPPTEVHQPAPPALTPSTFDPPTEVRQPNTPAPHRPAPNRPPPAPPASGTRFGWGALVALLVVVGALSFAVSWFFLRSDSDTVVSPPDPPATTITVAPTPEIARPTATAIPIPATAAPTASPTVVPAVNVTCSASLAQAQVEQQFVIDAVVSPPDPNAVLLFSHGDGGQSNRAPDQIFYFYPGTFDIELEWVSGQDRGTAFCGQVTVSGTPVGYRTCDPSRAPNLNGLYRVNVPDNPDDPENGLVVRLGPGVDKPARDILGRTRRDIQLTGCWQPLSGLNPWWQVEGGGWSSSCCLVEQ